MAASPVGANLGTASILLALLVVFPMEAALGGNGSSNPGRSPHLEARKQLTLEECLDAALENNNRRPASKYAVAMAEAQHRQALAAYWPQVKARGGYQHMDETPNFVFPASTISVAPTIKIPVPRQDVKLMDPDSSAVSADARWLVYDGGMRRGLREQTGGMLEVAKQESRRTDLEIVETVKRYYYGAVLTRLLHQLGKDTLARMETTLNLTETMYKEGSGRVKKTDYLDNKVMVESLRSAVAFLEKNEEMARAALANAMGLAWNETAIPSAGEIPFQPTTADLDNLVGAAYRFNPDWAKLEAGIRSAEGGLRTARSGHFPKVALSGEVHRWWNDYDGGIATDRNKGGWTLGVGVEIPIFEGFLTNSRISEARARLEKTKQEQFLLREGIGLQIKDIFLGMNAARKSHRATLDAMMSARENRVLNIHAYQNDLVETEKVIRAQLLEGLMSAQHYKMLYDHVALQAELELVVGTEVVKELEK